MDDVLIASYLSAFRSANPGKSEPQVTYSHGWYCIYGTKYRKRQIEELRKNLMARSKAADAIPEE